MSRTDRTLDFMVEASHVLALGTPMVCLFLLPFVMLWMAISDYRDQSRYEASCVSRFHAGLTVTPKCLDLIMTKEESK